MWGVLAYVRACVWVCARVWVSSTIPLPAPFLLPTTTPLSRCFVDISQLRKRTWSWLLCVVLHTVFRLEGLERHVVKGKQPVSPPPLCYITVSHRQNTGRFGRASAVDLLLSLFLFASVCMCARVCVCVCFSLSLSLSLSLSSSCSLACTLTMVKT